jgi:DNA-binding transcriptional MerR regulator
MKTQTQLKIGDVSRVTGVPIPTLCRWLDRRVIKPSRNDHDSRGTGDHRLFGRAIINQIAIARTLIELGMSAGPASTAASSFTEKGEPGRPANDLFEFGLTVLVHTESETSIRNLDPNESLSEAFGRNFEPAFILNVGPIIRTVQDAIISNGKNNK